MYDVCRHHTFWNRGLNRFTIHNQSKIIIFAEKIEKERIMIKPYPIGRQNFKAIIEDGYAYVDKIERMYEMVRNRSISTIDGWMVEDESV